MTRTGRLVVLVAAGLGLAACESQPRPVELRQNSEHFVFRITSDPQPPRAREPARFRVVVQDKETNEPVQNGEGRIFATSRDGVSTWDGFARGPEVGTYHGTLNFLTSGTWAMAIQFRRDSTQPLERIDWMQEVLPARGATP